MERDPLAPFIDDLFSWGRTNQAIIDATDEARECEHGKLPGDRIQTCDCWVEDEAA